MKEATVNHANRIPPLLVVASLVFGAEEIFVKKDRAGCVEVDAMFGDIRPFLLFVPLIAPILIHSTLYAP
jgi:hypothetical protein